MHILKLVAGARIFLNPVPVCVLHILELVAGVQVSGDWWRGSVGGREGLIPDKYILLKIRYRTVPTYPTYIFPHSISR